tara:strand:- start:3324 stop:3959 length:636 start_codon:yes stop_codon:yes gene_type:complete
MRLDNVTLVAVTSVKINESIEALVNSKASIDFASVKLLTDLDGIVVDGVDVLKIDKLSNLDEYSKFIVYDLNNYIDTEYALLVQYDGYVINPESWDDEFLKYDYIGAPWPKPNDDITYRDPFNNLVRVGNGGFSLRSKKVLSLPSRKNLEWKSHYNYYNEDGFICCHNRHIFEEDGCVFAPINVAAKFSCEIPVTEHVGVKSFGYHKHKPA